jgi:hypothetical protein
LALRAARDGAWFSPPGGARVSLARRKPLKRLLARLITARVERPGEPLTAAALRDSGWPGEKMSFESGRNRVYRVLGLLKELGLKDLLLRRDDGYLLDPEVPLAVEER